MGNQNRTIKIEIFSLGINKDDMLLMSSWNGKSSTSDRSVFANVSKIHSNRLLNRDGKKL